MAFSRSANRFWTVSCNKKRATTNASVAPMVEAKETTTTPVIKPKNAPPASVMIAAPGRDRAVTTI